MTNYVVLDGVVYDLVKREKLGTDCNGEGRVRLSEVAVGDTVKIGAHEMIVLEHLEEGTALIRKALLEDGAEFGKNNNYAGSNLEAICNEFAEEIAGIVGSSNVILHELDLTSDDGLKDYGRVYRKASLLTAEQYRRYVETLDKHKLDAWWWMATPFSTPAHEDADWMKCVSPAGLLCSDDCYYCYGVRPFCILKSNIFVSN